MRALVVDDVPLMRKVLTAKLVKAGFDQVFESGDADKALKIYFAQKGVELIVTDLKMPGLNGEDFIRKIRDSSTNPDVRVVMVSSDEGLEENRQLAELKIDAFLQKSELMEKLDAALEEVIAKIKSGAPLPSAEEEDGEPLDVEELKKLIASAENPRAELRAERLIVTLGEKELEIPLERLARIAKLNDIL